MAAKKTEKKTDNRTDKKIIAVVGATGAQGGGLVNAILKDKKGPLAVRAITRDPNSAKAKALADAGAEVIAADVDDEKSLAKAFKGAHGGFCVTFFWAHLKPEKELSQARNMAKAAKEAGVKHVIWSTLEDTRKSIPLSDDRMPTLMGKYKVPHFDAKGEANGIFTELGVPTTFLVTSFYWDNFNRRRASHGRANGEVPYQSTWTGSQIQSCPASDVQVIRIHGSRRPGQHVSVQQRV